MKQRIILPILLTVAMLASFASAKIGLSEAGKDIGMPEVAR
ncbi:hypothetical protein [Dyadobacter sp. MSC1_007]|nr:hypothetical protein [Dyadobacter sp. MSC1_007]